MNFLTKEMVGSYCWNNLKTDRSFVKESIVNGRKQYTVCQRCAVTMVAFVYEVFDPSVKRNKFVVNIGISRQHPCDTLNKQLGLEIASENAMINPTITLKFDKKPMGYEIKEIMWTYYEKSITPVECKTAKEVKDIEMNYWLSLPWFNNKIKTWIENNLFIYPDQNINIY